MDKWITKLWYIYTMDYHLATKKNKLFIHTTWMNLKGIMLRKPLSQAYIMYYSTFMTFSKRQTYMTESRLVISTGRGKCDYKGLLALEEQSFSVS